MDTNIVPLEYPSQREFEYMSRTKIVPYRWNLSSHFETNETCHAVAVHQARVDGATWIGHIDTDELLYPASSPDYSMHQVLDTVPMDVRCFPDLAIASLLCVPGTQHYAICYYLQRYLVGCSSYPVYLPACIRRVANRAMLSTEQVHSRGAPGRNIQVCGLWL